MATSSLLEIDFRKAYRQADELDDIARDTRRLADTSLEDGIKSVSANWKGDNSDAFQGKCKEEQTRITTLADDISSVAATIREIARLAEEAEEEARRLAKNRTSSSGGSHGSSSF